MPRSDFDPDAKPVQNRVRIANQCMHCAQNQLVGALPLAIFSAVVSNGLKTGLA